MASLGDKTLAALIAGAVSLTVALITAALALHRLRLERRAMEIRVGDFERGQARDRQDEEFRGRELSLRAREVTTAIEGASYPLRGALLERQATAYAALYPILQRHNRIRRWEEEPLDHAWSVAFIRDLHEVNADHGVFFSEPVYAWFGTLRRTLYEIETRLRGTGEVATEQEIEAIDGVISGPLKPCGTERFPGLGTALKDDLGSYLRTPLSAAPAKRPL